MENKLDRETFIFAMRKATPGAFEIEELMAIDYFQGGTAVLAALTGADGYVTAKILADGFNLGFAYAQAIEIKKAMEIAHGRT